MDLTSNLVQAKSIPTAHCPILVLLETLKSVQLSSSPPQLSMILGKTCVASEFLCSAGEWWNIIFPFSLTYPGGETLQKTIAVFTTESFLVFP